MTKKRKKSFDGKQIEPTCERIAKDDLEKIDQYVSEDGSRPQRVRVYRSIDTLSRMCMNGEISEETHSSALEFQSLFRKAAYDHARAIILEMRVDGGGSQRSIGQKAAEARLQIAEIMMMLGGFATLGASALWHIVGCGQSVSEFAISRGIHHQLAKGALIVALESLTKKSISS